MHGKTALVAGGASGIGRATALELAGAGASVVVGDVAAEAEVEGAVRQAVERFGGLDCACNAAGIQGPLTPTADYGEEDWASVIAVNLTGVWRCMKHELGPMIASGSGAIVNVASNFGLVGSAAMPAYCASKHGVIGLTKAAALDYGSSGIRVNAVCPGPTDTPWVAGVIAANPHLGDDLVAEVTAQLPLGRMGRPDEIAKAVVWLCSDAAAFVTGSVLAVDGGYVAR